LGREESYECPSGAAALPLLSGYRRLEPEKTVLYDVAQERSSTFGRRRFNDDWRGYP
jgi:hypothetical protein